MEFKLSKALSTIDASLILAVSSGILYVCGNITTKSFYSYFNVPCEYIEASSFDMLLSGSYQIPYLVSLFVIALIFKSVKVLFGFFKHSGTGVEADEVVRFRNFHLLYVMLIVSVVLLYCWLVLIERSSWYGLKRAERYAYKNAPVAFVQIETGEESNGEKSYNHAKYGIIAYTKDKYIFFEPMSQPEKVKDYTFYEYLFGLLKSKHSRVDAFEHEPFVVHVIDSNDVKEVKIIGRVSKVNSKFLESKLESGVFKVF